MIELNCYAVNDGNLVGSVVYMLYGVFYRYVRFGENVNDDENQRWNWRMVCRANEKVINKLKLNRTA